MFLRRAKYSGACLMGGMLLCVYAFSQTQTDYKKRRFTFHIEKPDTSIAFDVFAVNPKVKTNEQSGYSWYLEGKILETKGGFSGRLLDGRFVSYYGNKNLRERGVYVKGRKEGKWVKWHTNGKINEVTYWRMGVKQGKYVLSDDMGRRMLAAHFTKDKLNGTVITYEKGAVLFKRKYRNGNEIIPKIPKGKPKAALTPEKEKPSFLKSIFKKKGKGKEAKPVKEKKKKEVSISSTQ